MHVSLFAERSPLVYVVIFRMIPLGVTQIIFGWIFLLGVALKFVLCYSLLGRYEREAWPLVIILVSFCTLCFRAIEINIGWLMLEKRRYDLRSTLVEGNLYCNKCCFTLAVSLYSLSIG